MKTSWAVALIVLSVGCSAVPKDSLQDPYQDLSADPTPSSWEVGSHWNFVQYSEDGAAAMEVTLRVTDKPADTCTSGDWRVMELVDGQIGDGSHEFRQAYLVSGRLLLIDLTGWCDLGGIRGGLTDSSFEGRTSGGPFTFGRHVPQRVVGRRIN